MKWMKQQSKYENAAYAVLWGLLFAAPLLSLWVRTMHDSTQTFNWHEIWMVWAHVFVTNHLAWLVVHGVRTHIIMPHVVRTAVALVNGKGTQHTGRQQNI